MPPGGFAAKISSNSLWKYPPHAELFIIPWTIVHNILFPNTKLTCVAFASFSHICVFLHLGLHTQHTGIHIQHTCFPWIAQFSFYKYRHTGNSVAITFLSKALLRPQLPFSGLLGPWASGRAAFLGMSSQCTPGEPALSVSTPQSPLLAVSSILHINTSILVEFVEDSMERTRLRPCMYEKVHFLPSNWTGHMGR